MRSIEQRDRRGRAFPALRGRDKPRPYLGLIALLAIVVISACSPQAPANQPSPSPANPSPGGGGGTATAADVMVVEQSELEALGSKYVVSESRGEITASAACTSGQADKACSDAARQQLRDEAKRRGATLVVITSTVMRQTFPPQLSLRATLHEIRPRS